MIERGLIKRNATAAAGKRTARRNPEIFDAADVATAERSLAHLRWLAVVKPENWRRLLDAELSYTLLSGRYRNAAETLWPGASIVFYVLGRSRFVALATVSGRREVSRLVWPSSVFSYRIPLRANLVLPIDDGVPPEPLVPNLKFISTPPELAYFFPPEPAYDTGVRLRDMIGMALAAQKRESAISTTASTTP